MAADYPPHSKRPQPCLTRIDGVTCHGVLIPIADRKWQCTEGHTMWGSSALRSQPWPADRPHVPWFARLRARIFGPAKPRHSGRHNDAQGSGT